MSPKVILTGRLSTSGYWRGGKGLSSACDCLLLFFFRSLICCYFVIHSQYGVNSVQITLLTPVTQTVLVEHVNEFGIRKQKCVFYACMIFREISTLKTQDQVNSDNQL